VESELPGRANYVLRALELFAEFGDREALRKGDQTLTFAELRASVLDFAVLLREQGVRPGMSVAVVILLPIQGPALQLALHLLGCRVIWVLLGTGDGEVRSFLDRTTPDLFIYDPRDEDELGRAMAAHLAPVPVLCLGPGGVGPDLLAALDRDRPHKTAWPGPAELAGDSPESVHQTSGTTGVPKAILHTNACFQQTMVLAESWLPAGHPRLRHLIVTPLWWSAGSVMTMITLGSGGMLFIQEDWTVGEFLANVARMGINYVFLSPPMLYEVLDHPALTTTDLSSMYMFNVGSAPVAPARLRQAVARLGPVLRVAYGLSECPYVTAFPNITDDPTRPERLSSCGTAWGDVRIEIRAEDGRVLGPGEDGEVWLSSRLNFAGYLAAPELTAETLADGWLRTRDIGHLDADGYLYLVGRTQDSIVTGEGSRLVYARPIEDILTGHPRVRAAAVIGVPDPELVEVVHAYVVPDGYPEPTLEELRSLVTDRLPPIWAPRSVDLVDSLPLVGIGKVDKKSLRLRYATEHGDAAVGARG
jgi:fatty-acyl-CoA synthase